MRNPLRMIRVQVQIGSAPPEVFEVRARDKIQAQVEAVLELLADMTGFRHGATAVPLGANIATKVLPLT